MGQPDNSPTGLKSTSKTIILTFVLTAANFSTDFLIATNVITTTDRLIYGILAGGLLIGLYSIRFFKKENRRPFDYLKVISILLIAHYPFVYLYATEPWDNAVRLISLFIPATVYIYDRIILGPRTTRPVLIFTVIQTVLIGLFLIYTQIIIQVARQTEMKRVQEWEQRLIDKEKADKIINETNQKVLELKEQLENCR